MSDDINDGMKAWQDATNERMRTWHHAPAAPVPAIQAPNYNEQALSKFLWENCGFVSPSTAAELARQLLGSYRIQPIDCTSLPAPEAAPTREEIADMRPTYVSELARSLALDAFDDLDDEHPEAKTYTLARWFDAILALKSAPAK